MAAGDKRDYEGDFVTLARFLDPTEARVVCGCLTAAGVPARLADANQVETNAPWALALGGARILVPEARRAEAQSVLEAFRRGDFALDEDEPPQ